MKQKYPYIDEYGREIELIKEEVKHQGIGGHIFIKEFELTPDEIDNKAMQGNPACLNFCLRRDDFLPDFNKKCYYGKVKKTNDDNEILLGYVVCEDEFVKEV